MPETIEVILPLGPRKRRRLLGRGDWADVPGAEALAAAMAEVGTIREADSRDESPS